MNTLSFASGNKTYQVNDKVEISFNPASQRFVDEFMDYMDKCTELSQAAEDKKNKVENDKQAVREIGRELDREIAAAIDGMFGDGVAAALFPWGPATAWGDGFPEWLNFSLAIMDEIAENTEEQHKQTDPRMQKYLDKYKRYQKK